MALPFRDYHLIRLLESTSLDTPLDRTISLYFKREKALGSKDRAYISDTAYALIRLDGLLNHLANSPSWLSKLQLWRSLDPLLPSHLPKHIQVSFPEDLYNLLSASYSQAFELCQISNTRAPTTIRVNRLKSSRETLMQSWKNRYKVEACKEAPDGITFLEKVHFYSMPEFQEGLFEVQDEASQLVAALVLAEPGQLVLDYCAGSGGKALAIAPRLEGKGQLFLHDIRPFALLEAKKRLRRAGVQNYQLLGKKQLCDWTLVDVPCSGSGTLRRNPDLKWRFQLEDLQRLIKKQRALFEKALSFTRPGGHIVYATCSLLFEENEKQCEHFLKTYSLSLQKEFKSLPTLGGMDGFYAACFKKPIC